MPLVTLLLPLIFLGVILWLVSFVPMPDVIRQIIMGLAVLGVVLWLLHTLFNVGPGINLR